MSTWSIKTERDRKTLITVVKARALPFTARLTKGEDRSEAQNRLQRLWMNEAEEQGDQTAEEYRGYCKLHFGVPLMCAQDDDFAEAWERLFAAHLTYEQMLEVMMVPTDYPVTRLMFVKTMKKYLDQVYIHFTGLGFTMTDPSGWY